MSIREVIFNRSALAFTSLIFVSLTVNAAPSLVSTKASITKSLPDKILVRFKPGTNGTQIIAAHGKHKPISEHAFQHVDGLKAFTLPAGISVEQALANYRSNPNVIYAEPDFEVGLDSTNDTSYGQLWAINNTGQSVNGTTGTNDVDMNIPEAWTNGGTTGSNSVVIAVIDSGVQYTHPDLLNNMWVNPGETAGNSVDDDGNGYVDDVYGINAITSSGNPMDDNSHGTHVAGTIAAVGNNSAGITGVNQQAKILACKFISAAGSGATSDALKCLDYVYALKQKGINIVVSNNSWGGAGYSQSIADAIDMHRKAGIVFVAAAGNDGQDNDSSPHYPANYFKANVISVAATSQTDTLASFSDYGLRTVHVGAPGVNIYSTIPTNTYTYYQGTSMAAPHVTGLVALLSAQDATRDWRTLKNLVIASGKPIAALSGKSATGRRIRAYDTDGTGAMSCTNQTTTMPVYPQSASSTKIVGTQLGLAVININCATPAGSVSVTTSGPSTVGAVTLLDDGLGFDDAANDGIYSGYWTAPATTGTYTLTFGSTGKTQTVTVAANTSTLKPYRAPIATTYNPRVNAGASFTAFPENAYSSISSYTAFYDVLFGNVAATALYFTPKGITLLNAPSASQLTGANTPLPNESFETLIAPYWDDLDLSAAGNGIRGWAYYNGAATPVGEVVFEWKGVTKGTTNPVQFQIVFTANSADVEMQYIAVDNNATSATVGVQVDPTRATTQSYNIANTDIAAGKAWKWRIDSGVPTANAGTTQNVNGNALVTLSGSGSDPDGGALNYAWAQTSGTAVTLTGSNTLTPTFYAPNVNDTLVFRLSVTDDANQTTTSSVTINVTAVLSAGVLGLSASTYSVNESAGNATITVSRTGGSAGTVGLTYSTADGSASAANDYTYTQGTLSWANGDTANKTISIPITNDAVTDPDETLSILLSSATGGATLDITNATITISEVAPAAPVPGTLALSASNYSITENGASVTITVNRSGGSDGLVTVDYATADISATAGSDYIAASGTLSFAAGETTKSFNITLNDDSVYEGDESFTVTLSNATNGASLGTAQTTVTITDNESPSVSSNLPPETPTLISPTDGKTGVNGTYVEFVWNNVSDPDGDVVSYEFYLCIDSNFTACTPTTLAKAAGENNHLMLAGLGGGLGIGVFGLLGTLTRRQRFFSALVLIVTTLVINACAPVPPPETTTPITNTSSFVVANLSPNTSYYWKVSAVDGNGGTSTSTTWSFHTAP